MLNLEPEAIARRVGQKLAEVRGNPEKSQREKNLALKFLFAFATLGYDKELFNNIVAKIEQNVSLQQEDDMAEDILAELAEATFKRISPDDVKETRKLIVPVFEALAEELKNEPM